MRSLLASLALACLCLPAVAQEPSGILGYLDMRTGAFRPLGAVAPAAAGTVSNGTFKLTLNITAITAETIVSCGLSVSAQSATGPIEETANTSATVASGKAICVMTLPYSWRGATASSTVPISVGFSITGSPSLRTSVQGVALLSKVPANGSTTSFTLNATI